MAVIAIPIAEAVIAAGTWAYRAYRLYQAAKALEAIAQAQDAGKAVEEAKEKAQTAAQAKADAAASADCKNCNEDPDCQTARDKLRDALYGTKGDAPDMNRGLAERLCHWLHGSDEALRASHLEALEQAAKRVEKAREWLTGTATRPHGKKEGARLSKEAKNKKLKNCNQPQGMMEDAKELEKWAGEILKENSPISPIPRADFAAACTKDALGLVKNVFGR